MTTIARSQIPARARWVRLRANRAATGPVGSARCGIAARDSRLIEIVRSTSKSDRSGVGAPLNEIARITREAGGAERCSGGTAAPRTPWEAVAIRTVGESAMSGAPWRPLWASQSRTGRDAVSRLRAETEALRGLESGAWTSFPI